MFSPKDLAGKPRNTSISRVEIPQEGMKSPDRVYVESIFDPKSEEIIVPCWQCQKDVSVPKYQAENSLVYCSSECHSKAKLLRKQARKALGLKGLGTELSHERNSLVSSREGDLNAIKFEGEKRFKETTYHNVVLCAECKTGFVIPQKSSNIFCSEGCLYQYQGLDYFAEQNILYPAEVVNAELIDYYAQQAVRIRELTLEVYSANVYRQSTGKFKERTTTTDLRKVVPNQAQTHELDFLCPTPAKKVYRSVDEAYAFIDANHPNDFDIGAYTCRCSAIHIGHGNAQRTKITRINRVLPDSRDVHLRTKRSD